MPVLDAADRKAARPETAVHEGTRAVEAQVAGVGTRNRGRPVVAVRADIVERPIAVIPVAACCFKWLFNSSRLLKNRKRKADFFGNTLPGFGKKAIELTWASLGRALTAADSGPFFFISATFAKRITAWICFQFSR